jgi:Uma2 family endonuclease
MEDARSFADPAGLVTGDELLRLPHLNPCELVNGRIVRMTPTNADHGRIELNVGAALRAFVRTQNLGTVMVGEVGIFTTRNPDTVRAADVLFLSHERAAHRTRVRGFLDVAPEFIVEILSPDDTRATMRQKRREYFAIGVRLMWVVDPASRTVHVYRGPDDARSLNVADVLTGEDVLPGFTMPVAAVFE